MLALKKMKEERLQYLSERDEARIENEKLKAAASSEDNTDKENAGTSTRSTRSSASANASAADAKLLEEKDLLETKLRKYVRHTQSLEEAQAEIIDAIKTLGDSELAADVDKDPAGAVIALAEKLRACDDEIEELAEAAQSSSQHLVELQKLKEEKAGLERSLKRAVNGDGGHVAELEEAIAALEEERDSLQELAKSAKTNSSSVVEEQQRQVRYLESENLQLHQELKSLKKDLTSAKANAMMYEAAVTSGNTASSTGGDDTIDLGGISSSQAMQQMLSDAAGKENTNSQAIPSSPPGTAGKSKRSFASSVRKSVKKASRVGRTPGKKKPALGSGVGEAGDDATGECNQS